MGLSGTGILILCTAVALTSVVATLYVQRYLAPIAPAGGPPQPAELALPKMVEQLRQDMETPKMNDNKPEGAGTRWTPL